MRNNKLRAMIFIAMFSSISFVLMQLNFPIPGMPPFLKVDFSDIPAVMAAIMMGPVPAILVAALKNLLFWISNGSPTGVPVGEMANFTTTLLFAMPVYFAYKKMTTSKGVIIGLVSGVVAMSIGMSVLNYFVFLPMYTYFLGMPAMTGAAMRDMIIAGILPFNIIKGVLVSIVFVALFQTMKTWIEKQRVTF